MKLFKSVTAYTFALALLVTPVMAAEPAAQTCCEKAVAAGKEDCAHPCCVAAHKDGKSCEKCNPNKQDQKLIKSPKEGEKKEQPAPKP